MSEKRKRVTFEDQADDSADGSDQNQDVSQSGQLDLSGYEASELPFAKKFKHTLDSDEEDDEQQSEKYNVLDPTQFEGEEEGYERQEEEVKITPFNMNEELEEGRIDKDGMYIFNKKKDEIKDHWLDNIDWVKIKDDPATSDLTLDRNNQNDDDDTPPQPVDTDKCYQTLLGLMVEEETVQKAIQRLGRTGIKKGGNKKSTAGGDQNTPCDEEKVKIEEDKKKMLEIISVADQLVDSGDMDIYTRTFENLTHRLKQNRQSLGSPSMDIFADEDEDPSKRASTSCQVTSTTQQPVDDSVVRWEFKWEDKNDAAIHGPFSNDQMIKWNSDGYFEKGVYVRQSGKQDSRFYTSKRIDFELYS